MKKTTIKESKMITNFKLKPIVSKLLFAVLLLSVVIPNIELNSLAKTFSNANVIESNDPIEIFNMINDSFESVGISNRENLLMVNCNGELDINLAGDTISVIKDNNLDVYNLCYETLAELNQAKINLENSPNTIWVEKNERIELEEDPDATNELLTLNEVEEQHTYDVVCTEGIESIRFDKYLQEQGYANKTPNNNPVKIAIIDSGIDDFDDDGRIVGGHNFTSPIIGLKDETGQGTMLAKVISKSLTYANNDGQICPYFNYEIIPYKIVGKDGSNDYSKIASAISAAAENCDIINFSYNGLSWKELGKSKDIEKAIDLVKDKNRSFITTVDKNTNPKSYPSYLQDLTVVGSAKLDIDQNNSDTPELEIDQNNSDAPELDIDQNHSDTPKIVHVENKNSLIDFYAPVVDKMLIDSKEKKQGLLGDGLAAAYVSAMCAVYRVTNVGLTAQQIKKLIKQDAYYYDPEVVKEENNYSPEVLKKVIDYCFDFVRFPIKEEYLDVHRLYHPTRGAHYYTTSSSEKKKLVEKDGWRDEFIRWRSPIYPKRFRNSVAVYKAYNIKDDKYLFTKSKDEIDKQIALGGWKWDNEEPVFYAFKDGLYPIYRVYNRNNKDHLLTTDYNEYKKLTDLGWKDEKEKMYTDERYRGNDKKEVY